jgi:hypothetical protein
MAAYEFNLVFQINNKKCRPFKALTIIDLPTDIPSTEHPVSTWKVRRPPPFPHINPTKSRKPNPKQLPRQRGKGKKKISIF